MSHLEKFLNWLHTEGKDEKTIQAYKTTVSQFLEWYSGTMGHQHLTEVKPIDVKEYINHMKHVLNRKQATINKSTASLKTFFAFLADNGTITDNPMTRIKLQRIPTVQTDSSTKWLTRTEQERFISYVELEKNEFKRLRNLTIIDLMLYAGLRVAEVEELKLDDIKVNGNVEITIREGKKDKYAIVTLHNKHSKNVRNWLKYRETLTNPIHTDSPFVFVSERSEKLGSRGIQVMLDKYAKLANMENITPHRFRHSFCKNLANAGTPIEVIRRLARHESIQTTAIYVDPSYKEQLDALERI
ncbi:tyrosine-type recombinase/integrase [Fodinisporobacter ferrooxydans]|uniref:Tyrosine-type recombinase/integrase n=1 Tax=Fodinisporobacter ferrooxydans TaxID=2901836 RepID=A0ABY4CEZ8_9BACL|nr:tyrosine-type recombinase/integrase [Alicyclobacillaceae bacterium MYW30-H2]